MLLRLKKNSIKKCIMPAKSVGKPLVAETDKERCSAKSAVKAGQAKVEAPHRMATRSTPAETDKERCSAKSAVKAGKKAVQSKVEAPRRMATRSTPA